MFARAAIFLFFLSACTAAGLRAEDEPKPAPAPAPAPDPDAEGAAPVPPRAGKDREYGRRGGRDREKVRGKDREDDKEGKGGEGDGPASEDEITDPKYLLDLASVHQRYGGNKLAAKLLERAAVLAKDSKDPQDLIRIFTSQASQMQRDKNHKEAARLYEEVLKLVNEPGQRAGHMLALARCYEGMEDFDAAESTLKQLLKECETNTGKRELSWVPQTVNRQLASIWRAKPERAASAEAEAVGKLEKDPNDANALETLSQIYTQIKPDHAKAVAVLEKLWALKPEDTQVTGILASTLIQMQKYDKAVEVYKAMMEKVPASKKTYAYQAASALIQAERQDDAIAFAKEHLLGEDSDESSLSLMASLLDRAGKAEEAEKIYADRIATETDDKKKSRYMLQAVQYAIRGKKFDRAETLLAEVTEKYGKDETVARQIKTKKTQLEQMKKVADMQARMPANQGVGNEPPKAPTPTPPKEEPKAQVQDAKTAAPPAPAPAGNKTEEQPKE
ncbi:MAG: tetratricopeptide repeat protein [Planctomycetes bacterium]|nr:tetratricopeptide repeat protein [Planctomycetota bacterium]